MVDESDIDPHIHRVEEIITTLQNEDTSIKTAQDLRSEALSELTEVKEALGDDDPSIVFLNDDE